MDKDSFWPHHLKAHRNVYALLILDNCSEHKYLDESDVAGEFVLPDKLCIIFLRPNLTSRIQPAYIGIISVLKVRYKFFIVRRLYAVYKDQNFTETDAARKMQQIGCKGMAFRGKDYVLDVAEILNHIWVFDEKYAKTTSIKNCWKNMIS